MVYIKKNYKFLNKKITVYPSLVDEFKRKGCFFKNKKFKFTGFYAIITLYIDSGKNERGGSYLIAITMLRTRIFNDYCKDKDLRDREEEVRMELLEDSQNVELLRELGAILYYSKRDDEAITIYEKLLKLERKNHNFMAFLGYLHYELEEHSVAIDYFNRALDVAPDSPFIYFLLGNAYSRSGNIIEAIKSYDFAIFLDLDIYTAHLDFAKKYEDMGRKKRALQEYITAYEIDPRDKDIELKINKLKQETA